MVSAGNPFPVAVNLHAMSLQAFCSGDTKKNLRVWNKKKMAESKAQAAIQKLKDVAKKWVGPRWKVGQDDNMKDVMIEHGAYGLLEENDDRVFSTVGNVPWGLRDLPQSVADALKKEEKRMFVSENVTDNPYTSENFHYRGLRCITPCDNGKCEAIVPDHTELLKEGRVVTEKKLDLQCKEAPPEYRALAKLKHLAKMLPKMKKRTDGLVGTIRSRLETLRAAVSSDELYVSPTAKAVANGEYGSDELAKWKHFQEYQAVRDQIDGLSDPEVGSDLGELNNKTTAAEKALQEAQGVALRDLLENIKLYRKKWKEKADKKHRSATHLGLDIPVDASISIKMSVSALKKAVKAYEKRVDDAYKAQQRAFRTQISEWGKIQLTDPVSEELQVFAKAHFDAESQWQWSTYKEEWARLKKATDLPRNAHHIPKGPYLERKRAVKEIRDGVLTALKKKTADRIKAAKSENDRLRKEIKDTYGRKITDETTEDMPLKEHERRTDELKLKQGELASQLAKKVQRKRTEYEQLKAITPDSPVADGSLQWREYRDEYNKWHSLLDDSMFNNVRTVATYKALVQRLENVKNAQEEALFQVFTLELTSVRKNSALQKYNKLSELTLSAENTYTDNGNTYPKKVWDAWHVTFTKMNAENTTLETVSNMVSEFLFSTLNITQAKPVYSLQENMKNGDIGQVLGKLKYVLTLKHDAEKAYMDEQDAVRREEIARLEKASLEASPGPEFNNAVTQQVESLHQQSAEIVEEATSNISSVPSAMYDEDTFNKLGELSKEPSLKKQPEDQ